MFYTKLHYYYHTNEERLPFGFMKLSNNGHVGLEIEMLLRFPHFVSGAKFMSKLRFGDTDWDCELLSSTVLSAVRSALGALVVIARAFYF